MDWLLWLPALVLSVGLIVWGAETFAENLGHASARLGIGAFALALLLAGAEPEELATVVASSIRHSPGIAFGDILGSNVAMCLVALGLGAALAPLAFSKKVFAYALASLPVSVVSVVLLWDGNLSRLEGGILVGLYALYVAAIWFFERQPPALGEVEELMEAEEEVKKGTRQGRVSMQLFLVIVGIAAISLGATGLVEAVRHVTHIESTQTRVGLTLVGFATAFELVALIWSATRRGATDIALAGVIGSFGYNLTMSLGVGALVRPFSIKDASSLHAPAIAMLGVFVVAIALAVPTRKLERLAGIGLLAAYPVFVLLVLR